MLNNLKQSELRSLKIVSKQKTFIRAIIKSRPSTTFMRLLSMCDKLFDKFSTENKLKYMLHLRLTRHDALDRKESHKYLM